VGNIYNQIINGETAARRGDANLDSTPKRRINFEHLNAEYDLGIERANHLVANGVTTVWNALKAWINSPNDSTAETLRTVIAEARSSAAEVNKLCTHVQGSLGNYQGSEFPHGSYPPRDKAQTLASCTKQLGMVTVVLNTIVELEQIFSYYKPSGKQSALENATKIHTTFISWRRSFKVKLS